MYLYLLSLVALSFYIAESRPLVSQCTVIPAGSNMTDKNGDNIVFQEPVVTGKIIYYMYGLLIYVNYANCPTTLKM